MALPTVTKTWQYNVNQMMRTSTGTAAARYLADNRALLLAIKNGLIGFASSPWTVWGSSDGVGNFGNNDANDRWAAAANLIWANAGTNHSWIVLKQTNIAANYQICIDLIPTLVYDRATIAVSMTAGFGAAGGGVNGSATARPTATDEIVLQAASTFHQLSAGAAFDAVLHMMQSSDGQVTRFLAYNSAGTMGFYAGFEKPQNPVTGWTVPAVACWSRVPFTYANFNDVATGYYTYQIASSGLYCTSEAYINTMVGENRAGINDISPSEFFLSDIGLACEATAGGNRRGRHGKLFDAWWGSNQKQTGDTYPDSTARTLVQFSNIVVPWNGTVPRTIL